MTATTTTVGNVIPAIDRDPPEVLPTLLTKILSTRRADGTVGDTNFRNFLKNQIEGMNVPLSISSRGCFIVTVGSGSETLFSCHIDTCHSKQESTGQSQGLEYDSAMGHIFLAKESNASCLGADDGAGIFIMLCMIMGKVPGTYIFHTGEEIGGLGAKALMANKEHDFSMFKRAIAFDRPYEHEVIITQGGYSCASATAGKALADMLNEQGMAYEVSTKGVFTDTKVYAPVIPECFNIGVGYANQHSPQEYQNVTHLLALVDACLAIKWESIPTVRKPAPLYQAPQMTPTKPPVLPKYVAPVATPDVGLTAAEVLDELRSTDLTSLTDIVLENPEAVAIAMMFLHSRLEAKKEEIATIESFMGAL